MLAVLIPEVSPCNSFFLSPETSLFALICTLSRSFISPSLSGFHTALAYSKYGLTIVLYNITKLFLQSKLKFLFISPNIAYAFYRAACNADAV